MMHTMCLQDIQNQRAVRLGSAHCQLAVVTLVKCLAFVQLGDRQRATQELAAVQQMLNSCGQQQAADDQQALQQVQSLCVRVAAHLAGR
jgi:hypothetical protein